MPEVKITEGDIAHVAREYAIENVQLRQQLAALKRTVIEMEMAHAETNGQAEAEGKPAAKARKGSPAT